MIREELKTEATYHCKISLKIACTSHCITLCIESSEIQLLLLLLLLFQGLIHNCSYFVRKFDLSALNLGPNLVDCTLVLIYAQGDVGNR